MGLLNLLRRLPSVQESIGSFGERLAQMYAKTMPGAYVLHDVLIDGANGYTSQIDLVLICDVGVYAIEIKSFANAKIYGDADRTNWNYYSCGKKYSIYNPLKQNEKHIVYLKKFLKDFGDIPFFSIVTMICKSYRISGMINKEDKPTMAVCSSLFAMERAICQLAKDRPIVLNDQQKQEIFEYIKKHQHQGKEARAEHKQQVIAYKEKLEQQKEQTICPYCHTELVLRNGKYGEFYGCRNFPKCRYTMKK